MATSSEGLNCQEITLSAQVIFNPVGSDSTTERNVAGPATACPPHLTTKNNEMTTNASTCHMPTWKGLLLQQNSRQKLHDYLWTGTRSVLHTTASPLMIAGIRPSCSPHQAEVTHKCRVARHSHDTPMRLTSRNETQPQPPPTAGLPIA